MQAPAVVTGVVVVASVVIGVVVVGTVVTGFVVVVTALALHHSLITLYTINTHF